MDQRGWRPVRSIWATRWPIGKTGGRISSCREEVAPTSFFVWRLTQMTAWRSGWIERPAAAVLRTVTSQ